MLRHIKRLIRDALVKAGYGVFPVRDHYYQDGLFTVHNDHFRQDPAFRAAYDRGLAASNGVDAGFEWRVHVALWAAAASLRVPGAFVECGVNAGFMSSAIMQHLHWNNVGKNFYLVDTFRGPVLTQFSEQEIRQGRLAIARDALAAGAYVTNLDRIRANYAEWPRAIIVPGAIPEILETVDFGSVAFLHLDMNCAYPETEALKFFWKHLSPGAMVLLDDYAYAGYEQQAKAMDETAGMLGMDILSLPTGQGLMVKR